MDYHIDQIEEAFKTLTWDETYSFIEFLISILNSYEIGQLTPRINGVLSQEGAQYKLVNGQITALMTTQEADQISLAQNQNSVASAHINKAIELFNKRPNPDYANSIKESISAVEAVAREVTGNPTATLGSAVKEMGLHSSLEQGISKIYGWTSDEGGIRHASKRAGTVPGEAEARYTLVFCSALVTYLKEKATK